MPFTPRSVAYYWARNCDSGLSEDLARQVMLTVYRKADQNRDQALFRAWLLRIAHNALFRHHGQQVREIETVYDPALSNLVTSGQTRWRDYVRVTHHRSAQDLDFFAEVHGWDDEGSDQTLAAA